MSAPHADEDAPRTTELLAEAIQRLEEGGEASLEAFFAEHAGAAPTLRARLAMLCGVGLVRGEGEEPPAQPEPDRIGEFRLERRLGAGGMGVVYLAEQPSLRRRVALKLIRPELLYFPDARERFRREVEAVAQLEHPGIVRVYEAGEAGGVPWFAMEMVAGASLDRLLAELRGTPAQRLGDADLRRALLALGGEPAVVAQLGTGRRGWIEICCAWLLELAEALAYAHRHGVLHRDIKPANVMITWSGRAVLLDFGLASSGVGHRVTRTGSMIGSLPYMAPEQVRGEHARIDERTDVYGLGVTMYEMLTLRSAFRAEGSSDDEIRRRIVQATPAAPRQLDAAISWDAETVCQCAMAPEPAKRYQSAAALANDLRCLLELRPLAARRPPWSVRLHRFVRRRPALSAAAAMGFLSLVVVPSVVAVREHRLRTEIEQARADAKRDNDVREETLRFLDEDLLAAVSPDQAGRDVSMREVLDRAAQRIEARFADRPGVEAAIRGTLGHTYRKLGMLDVAERHLGRAVELSRQQFGEGDRRTLEAEHRLASVYHAQGRDREAEQLERRVFATSRELFGIEDPDTLASGNNLGQQLTGLGKHAEAVTALQEVVDVRLRVLGERHEDTATAMTNLALAFHDWGHLHDAEPWLHRALELERSLHGDDDPGTLVTSNNWANLLVDLGRLDEALAIHERVSEISRRVNGPNHHATITSLINLAKTLVRLGRVDEADARYREAVAAGASLPEDHPAMLDARLFHLGRLASAKRHEAVVLAADEMLALRTPGARDNERLFAQARWERAGALEALGRVDEAERALGSIVAEQSEHGGVMEAIARTQHARCLFKLRRFGDAEADLLAAYRFYSEHAAESDHVVPTMRGLAAVYEAWQRPDDAALWRRRLADWTEANERRRSAR
ncbi:MAG TPA: serine/threonine-protein kinase [Planctomycetota bacterium]|nr:serine/threonine-protein kinase [Planctomycetota bacterium]